MITILLQIAEAFAVCFFSAEYGPQLDYFGRVSGRDVDKISSSGLPLKEESGIPYFANAELVILCRKMGESQFDAAKINETRIQKWYEKDGVHTIYYGEIIKVLATNSLKLSQPK